jgi:hypothetical protein
MRDRLIELIQTSVGGCARHWAEVIADHLLAAGVIVPPCKVGDVVYKTITTSKGKPAIWEIIVTSISIDINEKGVRPNSYAIGHIKNTHCGEYVDFADFGKTVFLTREEAERALAERREG